MIDIRIQIGNRIKSLRIEKQLSQQNLALEADVDRSYLASVESGKRNISVIGLEKIVIALGISMSEFFKDFK